MPPVDVGWALECGDDAGAAESSVELVSSSFALLGVH